MSIMSREGLNNWLDIVGKDRILIAAKDVSGILLYHPVQDSSEVVWDYIRPVMSI